MISTFASVCKREKFGGGSFTHKMGKIYKNKCFLSVAWRSSYYYLSAWVGGAGRSVGVVHVHMQRQRLIFINLLPLMQSAVGAVSSCMHK